MECDLGPIRWTDGHGCLPRVLAYNLLRVACGRAGEGNRQTPQVRVSAANRKKPLLPVGDIATARPAEAHGHLLWDADGRTVSGYFHAPDVQSAAPVR